MKFKIEHTFDKNINRHYLNGYCTVLHCHHYATLTTQLAFDAAHFNGEKILKETSEDTFYRVLNDYFKDNNIQDAADKVLIAQDYWRVVGMGLIEFNPGDPLTAEMGYSHIDEGWLKKWGKHNKPVNIFTSGFVAAVASLINGRPSGSYQVDEYKSLLMGDEVSAFKAVLKNRPEPIKPFRKQKRETEPKKSTLKTNISRETIIEEMSKLTVVGDEQGLIPLFGVFVQLLPADFWNGFAQRLISNVSEDMVETAEYLLRNCAHECGYHTGHGIITSDIWDEIVSPMLKNHSEDLLHGALAVLTAWGWAMCEIIELIPGEKMIVRAYDYYESDIEADRPSAYMIQGITGAFMDLAYGGKYDVTGKTSLRTFKCIQTKGIEIGDEYGEFVVTKAL